MGRESTAFPSPQKGHSRSIEMQLFAPAHREFQEANGVTEWELELMPPEQIATKVVRQAPENANAAFQRTDVSVTKGALRQTKIYVPPPEPAATAELEQHAADGFLINGSVNNARTSPFAQLPAFGNNRRGQRSLYNGDLGLMLNQFRLRRPLVFGDRAKDTQARLQPGARAVLLRGADQDSRSWLRAMARTSRSTISGHVTAPPRCKPGSSHGGGTAGDFWARRNTIGSRNGGASFAAGR